MKSTILTKIYDRFYSNGFVYSDVTSSHWQSVGWHRVNSDEENSGEFRLAGGGFGDFYPSSPLRFLRVLGTTVELNKLARTYACDDNLLRVGKEVAKVQGRLFSFDCLKQVLVLSRVLSALKSDESTSIGSGEGGGRGPLAFLGIKRVCVIGDGYGYLGSLLKAVDAGVEVTSVNLGRGLFFDVYYTLLAHPQARLCLVGESANIFTEAKDFIFLPAESYGVLSQMPQDLVFNVASMQEMNISVVNNYMKYIRPTKASQKVLFYCCNRREKKLPAGEIIKFTDYGWLDGDEVYFDESCPWYRARPSGFFGRYLRFGGEVLHRFVSLSPRSFSCFSEPKQVI